MVTVQQLIERLLEMPRHYEVKVSQSTGPNSEGIYKVLTLSEAGLLETVFIEIEPAE